MENAKQNPGSYGCITFGESTVVLRDGRTVLVTSVTPDAIGLLIHGECDGQPCRVRYSEIKEVRP